MKKILFTTAIISLLFIGCSKENDHLFTPNPKMTQEQIIDLLNKALKNTISSDEISYTLVETINRDGREGFERRYEYVFLLDKQRKKSLLIGNEPIPSNRYYDHTYFYFVDGYNVYEYISHQSDTSMRGIKLSDVYWSHYRGFNKEHFDLQFSYYSWKIEEKKIVGKYEVIRYTAGGIYSGVLEVTLTKDLKINSYYRNDQMNSVSLLKRECVCLYTANPVMPFGYNISDFTFITQYEVKIIWEDGKENIFYDELGGFHTSKIASAMNLDFPPGQTLRLFYDANYTQPVAPIVILTENVVFYAKVVDL